MEKSLRMRSYIRRQKRKQAIRIIIVSICALLFISPLLKSHSSPQAIVNLHVPVPTKTLVPTKIPVPTKTSVPVPTKTPVRMMIAETQSPAPQPVEDRKLPDVQKTEKPTICDDSGTRSVTCEIEGVVVIEGNSTTISTSSYYSSPKLGEWKIKPYNRKNDPDAMAQVTELLFKPSTGNDKTVHCTKNHSIPAIIFSTGGYAGNVYHDFAEVLVPLFITSYQFHGDVQFIITDSKQWWIDKYLLVLKQLSKYEIITLESNKDVHCFQRTIVGTSFHKDFKVDPSKTPNGYSMSDFKEVLRKAFSLEKKTAIQLSGHLKKRPRLLILSRSQSRKFVNERQIAEMSKSLGYEVKISDFNSGTDVAKFARLVNSCDVFLGVHGAGLTNMVLLPDGGVVIQVVPLGRLEWLARDYYMEPSKDMKLKYLEYRILEEESTLIQQYPPNHPVIKDPFSIQEQGWSAIKSIYLEQQNVKIRLPRLKKTLTEALKLLRQSGAQ
ncbi:hypothetical protein AAC387_Pa09g0626 [Persea americana]